MKTSYVRFLIVALGCFIALQAVCPEPSWARNRKKEAPKEAAKEPKKATVPSSHRFFGFDDAPYFTSPDKRVGVKMLIDSVKVGPTLVAMQHITYLPSAHVGSHRHVYVTEAIYVLKGNLTLRIDKETKVMGPDSTAYIPPQTFHEYLNNSQDVCQFLQYYSPSGPEEEYRNWDVPGQDKSKATVPVKATGTVVVERPPAQVVPGSPQPVLGGVKEVDAPLGNTPAAEPTTPTGTPSQDLNKMQLKTRDAAPGQEKHTFQLKSVVAPPPAPKK